MTDYDCFYASVFEQRDPRLKSLPLGVKQKNILATCNYVARRRGVKKLMFITDAKKMCPDLVIIEGEDLTPFRDMSKTLFGYLRAFSWNGKAERLGFDEVFLDVTDIIQYNMLCLNKLSLSESFFYLSRQDPEKGFLCDLTSPAGCVYGSALGDVDDPKYVRLLLASHLAFHTRTKLEEMFGFTASVGVSTNKLLSKLAGCVNKPRNQTTLMSNVDHVVTEFMDAHSVRKVPGIGFKTSRILESQYLSTQPGPEDADRETSPLKVCHVRLHPDTAPGMLEKLLGGPGSERGVGERVWGLLHGVDDTEVKDASDIPSQISIEDTYKETLLPMMKRFHPPNHAWNLQLMNVCVANMAASGSEAGPGVGRDISVMFKKQDDVLRQWKIDTTIVEDETISDVSLEEAELEGFDDGDSWEDDEETRRCSLCGYCIPPFALAAHARYHDLGD
ncbi:DNA polymerase iota [Colletotrichum sidae]|uniref:DNA polymerase iota n=1 Tax=Colletotrichum sidae TaxID=1347389 RepID=A0A4R8TP46_9PEZI|nr:DNA polymerase iota [Colletotrichum sidae]